MDLFGPMPSTKHVVVVQDLASRFPVAKLVRSTRATDVIPALAEVYDDYGNPEFQLSDNGPLFNSSAMEVFAQRRDIQLQKIPPLHPSANPVETFMKPLGKAMKIAKQNNIAEKTALQELLQSYRDTPHPATNVPPSAMLFRDGQKGIFPRKSITEIEVQDARSRDTEEKLKRKEKVNSSKARKESHVTIGDQVMLRNYKRTSKFDPIFIPSFEVV